jgi:catechol 2,3-dioxygenase-like lactoylglutathione lyase family enzyme
MIRIKRLGHATLTTPDVERQVDYWTGVMGLKVLERSEGRVFLQVSLGKKPLSSKMVWMLT